MEDSIERDMVKENKEIQNGMYSPKITIIADDYIIPQLNKKRRISALLPYDYETSNKNYPVLYLHDGQNLFDKGGPYGNWSIDKKLELLAQEGKGDLIIIAVDHAEEERVLEFSPFKKTQWGKGHGKKYLQFLVETLKPYVDANFRTLPHREFTGVGGSSMGGLISIYAGLKYPEVFSKLMIFSPSLWVTPKIYFDAINFKQPFPTDIYLYAGGEESVNMVPNVEHLKRVLEKENISETKINIKLSIDPKGQHKEAYWGEEFPLAVDFLFFQK